VGASLNALQLLQRNNARSLFPLLQSRNNAVRKFNEHVRSLGAHAANEFLPKQTAYQEWLEVAREVALAVNCDLELVEMTLFANAEDLSRQAIAQTRAGEAN
jgi:hypothetical protein